MGLTVGGLVLGLFKKFLVWCRWASGSQIERGFCVIIFDLCVKFNSP
jgi:hypothetical protein